MSIKNVTSCDYSVTLRVASKTLTTSEISERMGCSATDSYEMGQLISNRTAPARYREEALWRLVADLRGSEDLTDRLEYFVRFISEKKAAILTLQENCDVELYCSISSDNGQGGFTLNSRLLSHLASMDIDIVFDLYLTAD